MTPLTDAELWETASHATCSPASRKRIWSAAGYGRPEPDVNGSTRKRTLSR
jgi:hypothetical protein